MVGSRPGGHCGGCSQLLSFWLAAQRTGDCRDDNGSVSVIATDLTHRSSHVRGRFGPLPAAVETSSNQAARSSTRRSVVRLQLLVVHRRRTMSCSRCTRSVPPHLSGPGENGLLCKRCITKQQPPATSPPAPAPQRPPAAAPTSGRGPPAPFVHAASTDEGLPWDAWHASSLECCPDCDERFSSVKEKLAHLMASGEPRGRAGIDTSHGVEGTESEGRGRTEQRCTDGNQHASRKSHRTT